MGHDRVCKRPVSLFKRISGAVLVVCAVAALLLMLMDRSVLEGYPLKAQNISIISAKDMVDVVAALQPHLRLVKACQGPSLPDCSRSQASGLRHALRYGTEHASSVWKIWDREERVERPEYGFWRLSGAQKRQALQTVSLLAAVNGLY